MPKPRTYYCQTCDRELWPTRDGRYWACPNGCGKLLSEKHCNANCTMTSRDREESKRRHREYMEQKQQDVQLPIAGVWQKHVRERKKDLWVVEGLDGKYMRVGFGRIDGCVHAICPENKWRPEKRVVSLRRVPDEVLLKLLLGNAA